MKQITMLITMNVFGDTDEEALGKAERLLETVPGYIQMHRNSAYPFIKTVEDPDEGDEYRRSSFEYWSQEEEDDGEEWEDVRENPARALRPSDFPDNPDYQDFIRAMKEIGVPCRMYHGRFFYVGPAAVSQVENGLSSNDLIAAAHAAGIEVRTDNMGYSDTIVYVD